MAGRYVADTKTKMTTTYLRPVLASRCHHVAPNVLTGEVIDWTPIRYTIAITWGKGDTGGSATLYDSARPPGIEVGVTRTADRVGESNRGCVASVHWGGGAAVYQVVT